MPVPSLFLAKIQYYGWGVERNPELVETARPAAGLADTHYFLAGIIYDAGATSEAVKQWEVASELGSMDARYNLGVIYRERKNDVKAARAFQADLESDPGHYKARSSLGQMYIEGWGVDKNEELGFSYYKRVADEASGEKAALSQYVVGGCYLKGIGVDQSDAFAREYLKRSTDNGFEPAQALDNTLTGNT